ncbi:MAG: pro-sigmaK processing inhibitor BofA family protein [Clostridia bacterium]|nr:pro-sigmaK processing inhibitor BofA family protein [Clostridia bacterium]
MEDWVIPAIGAVIFLTLVIVHAIMRSNHPVRSAVLSLIPGIAALICVNLASGLTAVAIPVSPLTLSTSAVLGIPGVTCLLILQRIL